MTALPCPFCGIHVTNEKNEIYFEYDLDYTRGCVYCPECSSHGPKTTIYGLHPEHDKEWKKTSVKKWNERISVLKTTNKKSSVKYIVMANRTKESGPGYNNYLLGTYNDKNEAVKAKRAFHGYEDIQIIRDVKKNEENIKKNKKTESLFPCPFCGTKNKKEHTCFGHGYFMHRDFVFVFCPNCFTYGPMSIYEDFCNKKTLKEAIELWNNREDV